MEKNRRRMGKRSLCQRSDDEIPTVNPKGRAVSRGAERRNHMQHRFFERTPARRIALFLIFALSLSSFAMLSFRAFAQDEKQDKKKAKQREEKMKEAQKEKVKSVYRRWKDEDVRWIITDEEIGRAHV